MLCAWLLAVRGRGLHAAKASKGSRLSHTASSAEQAPVLRVLDTEQQERTRTSAASQQEDGGTYTAEQPFWAPLSHAQRLSAQDSDRTVRCIALAWALHFPATAPAGIASRLCTFKQQACFQTTSC